MIEADNLVLEQRTFGERIESRLNDLGRKQADLARHLKKTPAAVSAWKTGATKGAKQENFVPAAKFLATTEEWLVFGRDPRCDRQGRIREDRPYPAETIRLVQEIQSLPVNDPVHLQGVVEELRAIRNDIVEFRAGARDRFTRLELRVGIIEQRLSGIEARLADAETAQEERCLELPE